MPDLRSTENVVGYDGEPLYRVVVDIATLERVRELTAAHQAPRWSYSVYAGDRVEIFTRVPEWFAELQSKIRTARGL